MTSPSPPEGERPLPDGHRPIDPETARRIRLVSLDVDGVLTDGALWFDAPGVGAAATDAGVAGAAVGAEGPRAFHVHDGLGIRLLMAGGLEVALVSGRRSGAVEARANELGVGETHLGTAGKVTAIEGILSRHAWAWGDVAHLGDDLTDLPVFERAGLAAAVGDAVPEVLAASAWRSVVPGGRGAVRDFARALLTARGVWEEIVEAFVRDDAGEGAE